MKLSGAAAQRAIARPDPACPALLIYGADAMRVALKRAEAVRAIAGEGAADEMRLTRLAAADLRKDPAALGDAIKAMGFFPGPRVVVLEDAGDGHAPAVAAALADWAPADARLIVTGASLTPSSALRKLFESHPAAAAIGVYDDPPDRAEVERIVRAAGIAAVDPAAMSDLLSLAGAIDPGDFRQTVEKLALYAFGSDAPVTSADVAAIAPAMIEAEVEAVIDAAAEGRASDLCVLLRRIGARTDLGRVAQLANEHFRRLLALKSDPAGADTAIGRLKPPVYGPRRDRLMRQTRGSGAIALTAAVMALTEVELTLRSASKVPDLALVERALVRIAHRAREEGDRAGSRR
jgi:DNA polymerase-3 subunit delta